MGIFRSDEDGPKQGGASGRVLPLLPLRDIVVFPHMVVPLFVGRSRSIRALDEAMERDRDLLLCAQRESGEDPEPRRDARGLAEEPRADFRERFGQPLRRGLDRFGVQGPGQQCWRSFGRLGRSGRVCGRRAGYLVR